MESFARGRSLFPYLAGAVVLVLLALRVLGGEGGAEAGPSVTLDGAPPAARAAAERGGERRERVYVHVAGSVRRPGLYRIPAGARAGEAVDAAGGLTRRADLRAVNLASTVRDGQQVIVPARGERAATGPSPGQKPGDPAGAKLSLASATVEQLDALDGIGPTLAQRIVEWRDAHGGFRSVEQLREVEGIGAKRFESLSAAVEP